MNPNPLCVNCKGNVYVKSKSYVGFFDCAECGFIADLRTAAQKVAARTTVTEDPMDSLMCESCQ